MEEEHVVVRTLISRIGRCKEKLKARRSPAQWAQSLDALTNRYIEQVSFRYVCHYLSQQKEEKHKVYPTKHYVT
jgi:hypothetical protein